MLIKRKPLARRTFLKGLGVSIGLPYLEIMCAKESFAMENINRTAFVYVPNGWYRQRSDFFPAETGANYSSRKLLTALDDYKNDFNIISNLSNEGGEAGRDREGDHARAAGTYLSSVRILKDRRRVSGGQTIDRYISDYTKTATPIDMLLMGFGRNDSPDSGYNNANKRLSWKNETSPIHWDGPRAAFDKLVANNDRGQVNQQTELRNRLQKSVLDFVMDDDLPKLRQQLGQNDREKLDSYLSGLRDMERQISQLPNGGVCNLPEISNFNGSMSQQISLMFEIMATAFECDLTRVAVIGFADEVSDVKPDGTGIRNGWHTTSHYRNNDQKMRDYEKIGFWVTDRAADLMKKMRERNLMQSSLVSFGAGTGGDNSEAHGDHHLPTLLIGQGNGAVATGRHIVLPNDTPIANLWATLAKNAGRPVPNNRWGNFGTGLANLS